MSDQTGYIHCLNTGNGHLELKCDPANPIEMDRAKRAVTDMLRRGYVLFIEGTDGKLIRVQQFDEKAGKYIVADVPGAMEPSWKETLAPIGEAMLNAEKLCPGCHMPLGTDQCCHNPECSDPLFSKAVNDPPQKTEQARPEPAPAEKKRWRPRKIGVPMEKAKVTAIGRSAGG